MNASIDAWKVRIEAKKKADQERADRERERLVKAKAAVDAGDIPDWAVLWLDEIAEVAVAMIGAAIGASDEPVCVPFFGFCGDYLQIPTSTDGLKGRVYSLLKSVWWGRMRAEVRQRVEAKAPGVTVSVGEDGGLYVSPEEHHD